MDPTSKGLTKEEIEQLAVDFADYPYIIKTIAYFSTVSLRRKGYTEAMGYLRDLQQIANLLAVGERNEIRT
jgi:hypothetical protein